MAKLLRITFSATIDYKSECVPMTGVLYNSLLSMCTLKNVIESHLIVKIDLNYGTLGTEVTSLLAPMNGKLTSSQQLTLFFNRLSNQIPL